MNGMNDIIKPLETHKVEQMSVQVYEDRSLMGTAAASQVAQKIRALLQDSARQVRIVFAAAPSQNELYEGLVREQGIDWSRVNAFHMDEYIGLAASAPQRFGRFLTDRLYSRVNPGRVELLDGLADVVQECQRYSALLSEAPIDIVCLGIGENGHIAFNDPPVANFTDPQLVKAVELEEACRRQQVNDGCFTGLDEVPTHALTLTVPALLAGRHLYGIVPGVSKRNALQAALHDSISTACPATILRTHPEITMFTDRAAFGL
ncbi:glucosamine-6-phosphate deaminase [Paenibacillus odorifer]|nr:glucosamine-6-phosphate deaminase [Paenibacillus odorifer]OME16692.1 glucosamine-6-phosphate deaminase [Paenibacillus odorifer]OME28124.1 glucosamine-6-phosphate deaminase [Paenibacillus odorifer]OME31320.1 glucosamine-6-phosphate deaminase [Paenibacillus odorifer]OME46357.1 glucosamine-6-phosphate deaminase [Paenibacillus odorifer]